MFLIDVVYKNDEKKEYNTSTRKYNLILKNKNMWRLFFNNYFNKTMSLILSVFFITSFNDHLLVISVTVYNNK